MYRLYIIALTAVGMMGLVAVFVVPHPRAAPLVVASAKSVTTGEPEALLLRRDSSGQFHLEASVNGAPVEFLVDTGADIVALTEEEAANLGLNVLEGDFQPVMQTASGVGYGAKVRLDEVAVAGERLRDVDVVVVKGLTVNLLGQSALRKLGSVQLKGDNMIIQAH
jgi:aspartyl protease family protein